MQQIHGKYSTIRRTRARDFGYLQIIRGAKIQES